jgi:hypothetical protein
MEYVKYMCPKCFHESREPGVCPKCHVPLIASCVVCANPIVGEQIHLDD